MNAPEGFRFEQGLLWPDYDVKCAQVVFKMTTDLDHVMRFCAQKRRVVQAGGNCGVWPRALAPHFEQVMTFEPDPRNFLCLEHNTRGIPNILKYNTGLGNGGRASMFTPSHELDNCGALQVDPCDEGEISLMKLDALNLQELDLLYLDIEGFEIPALLGAAATIARCRPIVAIEDKGLSERYGYKKDDAVGVMRAAGYAVVKRMHRDVIFAPR
jgi:FkbM family methyltransferase